MIFLILTLLLVTSAHCGPEENEGVRYASNCEACKILATELEARLSETGRSHDVIQTGYSLDDEKSKKRTEYRRSELRLLESMENVCDRILEYNIHKERKDSTRFAKGMSQTFQTLHALVDKGVKVDLGIPHELWDKPSAEITRMKTQCETMVERYEGVIEKWYFHEQNQIPLIKYLCENEVLKGRNSECLYETFKDPKIDNEAKNKPMRTEEL
ncbi:protein canopy homolog 4-like [Wyeomyia smithii]|uniref:protein canopy homolog 4-like n=1 Tax=Wyeomyia smithii TaxID=174621 RepID=UPI002467DE23|nr:protein canopy homolog 4-like [Wyeomyia smithii]XP_055529395.1 protein canopy homolog 4-like [Wyeomyia smithii]XP_055529396.1 protein canopy homolog 4-like [Wyeomyia smithii]XP_055529397.1 protein canopy homolog 4-like [Wyeomyia smithii]XP_055529398.1 protein canopy homolog 4-like [Wyeomyia smithii]XP_055529399.1 protein canopy homolog 4-like [Wyeomyia smithii]XP_055529400.1 protein canopy homolog 4-like [Wyeomyia smithii]XP_055529401.1 protein canopy homolog 4-like [Wyeomyia smithii]XP_